MVVGFCFVLMFFFVPETFWDRTPQPHSKSKRSAFASISNVFHHNQHDRTSATNVGADGSSDMRKLAMSNSATSADAGRLTIAERRRQKLGPHVGFADSGGLNTDGIGAKDQSLSQSVQMPRVDLKNADGQKVEDNEGLTTPPRRSPASHELADRIVPRGEGPATPGLHNFNSPYYIAHEKEDTDYIRNEHITSDDIPVEKVETALSERSETGASIMSTKSPVQGGIRYTTYLRTQPPKSYVQTLKPWNGQLRHENWFKVAIRPFILFAYPAILWSTLVYSLSIGWLIVLSESVSTIYKNPKTYNFTALQTGLVYVSPFVGGILGTAVAGKVSDLIVRAMSRRNGGVYEPEFRLVMAIPIALSTCIGLMGFGWSAQERDNWVVPTVFFGIISFGCALGSTTSITFAVDSYRQYAGEALVTLNFSKSG